MVRNYITKMKRFAYIYFIKVALKDIRVNQISLKSADKLHAMMRPGRSTFILQSAETTIVACDLVDQPVIVPSAETIRCNLVDQPVIMPFAETTTVDSDLADQPAILPSAETVACDLANKPVVLTVSPVKSKPPTQIILLTLLSFMSATNANTH